MIYTKKEVKDALNELVKRGYLKRTKGGYIDSDKVTTLLKKGKTRKQIAKILDKLASRNSPIQRRRNDD